MDNNITIDIDYKVEYHRLKGVEKENQELKETIIEMSKYVFKRDNVLVETIKEINESFKTISKTQRK